jgi:3-methyladenine DNA glycosylase Tag
MLRSREGTSEMTPPGPPDQIKPKGLSDYLDVMSKAVFQSGMSWKVIENKWPETREALRDFEPHAIADMDESDIDELMQDRRVVRNRRKLEATVHNARTLISIDDEHAGFHNYLRSHDGFWPTVKSIRSEFKFMGDMGTYYFLYVVGEEVIPHEQFEMERKR